MQKALNWLKFSASFLAPLLACTILVRFHVDAEVYFAELVAWLFQSLWNICPICGFVTLLISAVILVTVIIPVISICRLYYFVYCKIVDWLSVHGGSIIGPTILPCTLGFVILMLSIYYYIRYVLEPYPLPPLLPEPRGNPPDTYCSDGVAAPASLLGAIAFLLAFLYIIFWARYYFPVILGAVRAWWYHQGPKVGPLPKRRGARNLFLELFLLSLLLIPAALIAAIGALHTTLWLIITGSTVVLYLLLPLAANLLAVAVVFLRNAMHSLLSLIGVFLNAVFIFIVAGAEFLGLVFLIVYVGAVAILFLFVIMLLNVKSLTADSSLIRQLLQKASFAIAPALSSVLPSRLVPGFYIQTIRSLLLMGVQESTTVEAFLYYVNYRAADVMSFATLYTDQVALFLLITCVLLIAMLGAIVLATATLEEDEPISTNQPYPSATPLGSGVRYPAPLGVCAGPEHHVYLATSKAPPWFKQPS